jgi:hypothetical protein
MTLGASFAMPAGDRLQPDPASFETRPSGAPQDDVAL